MYCELVAPADNWQLELARAASPAHLEPPIVEAAAAGTWCILSGESFLWARLTPILAWILAAFSLRKLLRSYGGYLASLSALVLYLMLPFAVTASRSLQPDPLMVAIGLTCFCRLRRFVLGRKQRELFQAASLAALAIFIKPHCLFIIVAAWFAFADGSERSGHIDSGSRRWFFAIAVTPALLYYGINWWLSPVLSAQASLSFTPWLLTSLAFWAGWLSLLSNVLGPWIFACVLISLLLILWTKQPLGRVCAWLWGGYAMGCLVFSYHTTSHDYYHLFAIPIAAITLAGACELLVRALQDSSTSIKAVSLFIAAVIVTSFLHSSITESLGSIRLVDRVPNSYERMAEQIGAKLNHSKKVVTIGRAYGYPLKYFARIAGPWWPNAAELRLERERNTKVETTEQMMERRLDGQDFFVVTNFYEFRKQSELSAQLGAHYRVFAFEHGQYLIYDLRQRSEATKSK